MKIFHFLAITITVLFNFIDLSLQSGHDGASTSGKNSPPGAASPRRVASPPRVAPSGIATSSGIASSSGVASPSGVASSPDVAHSPNRSRSPSPTGSYPSSPTASLFPFPTQSRSPSPMRIRSRSRSPNGTHIPLIFQKGQLITPKYSFPPTRVVMKDDISRTGYRNTDIGFHYTALATRNGDVFGIYDPHTGLFRRFLDYLTKKPVLINMYLADLGYCNVSELEEEEIAYLDKITPRILRLPIQM